MAKKSATELCYHGSFDMRNMSKVGYTHCCQVSSKAWFPELKQPQSCEEEQEEDEDVLSLVWVCVVRDHVWIFSFDNLPVLERFYLFLSRRCCRSGIFGVHKVLESWICTSRAG